MSEKTEKTNGNVEWFMNLKSQSFTHNDVQRFQEMIWLFGCLGLSPQKAAHAAVMCCHPAAADGVDLTEIGLKIKKMEEE
jgi:hypothetical protein